MSNPEEPSLSQEDLFLQCYSRDRHRIYKFIFSLFPNEADAEDVFQQASVVLWRSFAEFDPSREFYPWACGVALNAVRNYRRASKRRAFLLSDELLEVIAEEQISTSQRGRYRLELLEECLTHLKPKDRELLQRVYGEDTTAANVAEQMGRSVQTIYNRLNLIRKNLLHCVNRKSSTA